MPRYSGPLLTRSLADEMLAARSSGASSVCASFDLGRSTGEAMLDADGWQWNGGRYPWPGALKDRTLYFHDGAASHRFSVTWDR